MIMIIKKPQSHATQDTFVSMRVETPFTLWKSVLRKGVAILVGWSGERGGGGVGWGGGRGAHSRLYGSTQESSAGEGGSEYFFTFWLGCSAISTHNI